MSFRDKLDRFAAELLKPINPTAVVLLGAYTILWGLWVMNPFWDVFTSAKLFSALLALPAPEAFWGGVAVATGIMTTYGALKPWPNGLARGAAVSGWHWFMIAIFYFMGDFTNTGGITSLFFAIYSAYLYLNVKINRRE